MKTLRVSLKSLHGEFIGYKSFVVVYFFWHSFFSCAYDIMFRYHVPSLAVWLDSRYLYQSEKYALKIICITKKSLTTTSHFQLSVIQNNMKMQHYKNYILYIPFKFVMYVNHHSSTHHFTIISILWYLFNNEVQYLALKKESSRIFSQDKLKKTIRSCTLLG